VARARRFGPLRYAAAAAACVGRFVPRPATDPTSAADRRYVCGVGLRRLLRRRPGVVLLAVLGLVLPDSVRRTSGLRTALSILVNGVAAAVFLIHGGLAWKQSDCSPLGA